MHARTLEEMLCGSVAVVYRKILDLQIYLLRETTRFSTSTLYSYIHMYMRKTTTTKCFSSFSLFAFFEKRRHLHYMHDNFANFSNFLTYGTEVVKGEDRI